MPLLRRPKVERLKRKRDVQGLVDALEDKEIANEALQALIELRDSKATEAVIARLKDSDWIVRWRTAEALGNSDVQALGSLIEALGDEVDVVRKVAAQSLAQLGDPQAIPALVSALDNLSHLDEDASECARLIDSLRDLRATRELVNALSMDNWRARSMAARELGALGSQSGGIEPWAIEALVRALRDSSDSVRMSAARALKVIGGPEAEAALATYREPW